MSLEQLQPRRVPEIIRDGLNSFFLKFNENGIDLRVFGSALKGATYSTDLTNEEISILKNDLESLLNKDKFEVVIFGLSYMATGDYSLKFTRAFNKNLVVAVEDGQFEEVFKMKIKASDLLELLG